MILKTDCQEFSDNLEKLSILYKQIKAIILLAEIVSDEQAVLLTAVNEMRNAFDHIMRCYLDNSDYKKHIDKARGHLYRAGYDAYELMAIDIFLTIKEQLNEFSALDIANAMPEYYGILLPRMNILENELVDARANKKPDSIKGVTADNIKETTEAEFKQYDEIVSELMQIKNKVIDAIPKIIQQENINKELEKYIKESKFRTRFTITLAVFIILATIVSLWMD